MTTVYKKVEKVIEREEFVSCTCDRCGKELEEDYGNRGYDYRDFEFSFAKGNNYEGGYTGNREGWEIEDLCDDCIQVLEQLLKDNGFKLKKIDEVW